MEKYRPKRIKGMDYNRPGDYFITLIVRHAAVVLWDCGSLWAISNRPNNMEIIDSDKFPVLSKYGMIVDKYIREIEKHYRGVEVTEYSVMPNHVHMMIKLEYKPDGNGRLLIAKTNISTIVQQLKQAITKELGENIWARTFVDRVIRNEEEKAILKKYIKENPKSWNEDSLCPKITADQKYDWLKIIEE